MAGVILFEAETHTCEPPKATKKRFDSKNWWVTQDYDEGSVWLCPCGGLYEVRIAEYSYDKYKVWYEPTRPVVRKYRKQVEEQAKRWQHSSLEIRRELMKAATVTRGETTDQDLKDMISALEAIRKRYAEQDAEDAKNSLSLANPNPDDNAANRKWYQRGSGKGSDSPLGEAPSTLSSSTQARDPRNCPGIIKVVTQVSDSNPDEAVHFYIVQFGSEAHHAFIRDRRYVQVLDNGSADAVVYVEISNANSVQVISEVMKDPKVLR